MFALPRFHRLFSSLWRFRATSRGWGALATLVGLALGAGLLWRAPASLAQNPQPAKAAAPVPVLLAQAVKQDQALSLSAVGLVQASQQAVVRARIEGLLTEVRFTEGQAVRAGQVLARLDDRILRAQLEQAEAELRRLQAQLALAQADLQRFQGLASEQAISIQQRDQQQALVAQLQAQVQAQGAAVSQARTALSHTVVTAPFAGRVGLRQVDVGNIVRPADPQGIVTLAQTQPLVVVFNAPQSRLSDVRQALARPQGAVVSVAEQEGGEELAKGRLRATDNAVDAGSGTLRLKAELAPAGERLWPGQFVTVRLQTGVIADALTVPARAVQRGLKGSFVWRVTGAAGQGQANMLPVQVSWQSDTVAVIQASAAGEGLQAGDRVVVDGHARLKPGAVVKALQP